MAFVASGGGVGKAHAFTKDWEKIKMDQTVGGHYRCYNFCI